MKNLVIWFRPDNSIVIEVGLGSTKDEFVLPPDQVARLHLENVRDMFDSSHAVHFHKEHHNIVAAGTRAEAQASQPTATDISQALDFTCTPPLAIRKEDEHNWDIVAKHIRGSQAAQKRLFTVEETPDSLKIWQGNMLIVNMHGPFHSELSALGDPLFYCLRENPELLFLFLKQWRIDQAPQPNDPGPALSPLALPRYEQRKHQAPPENGAARLLKLLTSLNLEDEHMDGISTYGLTAELATLIKRANITEAMLAAWERERIEKTFDDLWDEWKVGDIIVWADGKYGKSWPIEALKNGYVWWRDDVEGVQMTRNTNLLRLSQAQPPEGE